MASESVVVAKSPSAPPVVRSVDHDGRPATSFNTRPSPEMGSRASEFVVFEYKISPAT